MNIFTGGLGLILNIIAIAYGNATGQDALWFYGSATGAGIEFANPKVGRFLLEGRYYYGLGNIYGDSKRDYFGSSNFGTITIKLTYLFDITR